MRSRVLDANVLVLLIVGFVDRRSIATYRRIKEFTEVDFDLLIEAIDKFDQLVVTTSVLTEASNLLGYAHQPLKQQLLTKLGGFVGTVHEERPESAVVVEERVLIRLGLTDAGLLTCVRQGHYLLTMDLSLYLAAIEISDKVVNFNHLRQGALLA